MQMSLHRNRAKVLAHSSSVHLEKLLVYIAYVLCTHFTGTTLISQPDVSHIVNVTGYLLLATPRAMQMKPFISKHVIFLIIPQLVRMTPSNASIQLPCMSLHITVDSFPKRLSSVPITSSVSSLLLFLSTSRVIS